LPAQLARVGGPALETLRAAWGGAPPAALSVLVVPSRAELAALAPGVLLLSDRAFHVTPLRQARAFHDRAVRRALFGALIEAQVEEVEPPADRELGVGLRAVLLD